jgi:DNA-binding CsgD family transcriptional regulator
MLYMTVAEASEKWGVSLRQVQRLVAVNRIPGALKFGRAWMLPDGMEKPADLRRDRKLPQKSLFSDLAHVIASTTIPMPSNNPDAILDALGEERLRLQYESELAYLRGDFAHTMLCFQKTAGDDAARLRASLVGVAAAISLGDYHAYTEIETYLKDYIKADNHSEISAFAELALAGGAVSVNAPNMVPDWLKEGDFSVLAPQASYSYLIYLRAKYFQCTGNYEAMLAAAQTALTFCSQERGLTFSGIYLRMTCAVACHYLEREDDARGYLLETMRICLPHGFITPFVELASELGGLAEQCLEQEFPDYRDAVIRQWKRTVRNWVIFHNQFTRDNITLILSLREYHLASLVVRCVPYAKIAKQHCISIGRLKNIVLEIYEKLHISGRDELARYILAPKKT